jgi:hypothetical protein
MGRLPVPRGFCLNGLKLSRTLELLGRDQASSQEKPNVYLMRGGFLSNKGGLF